MQTLRQDIAYALRQMRQSPVFTLTAMLTLALGIGATTAIFSLIHTVMLKSLPVVDPASLYRIGDGAGLLRRRTATGKLGDVLVSLLPAHEGVHAGVHRAGCISGRWMAVQRAPRRQRSQGQAAARRVCQRQLLFNLRHGRHSWAAPSPPRTTSPPRRRWPC